MLVVNELSSTFSITTEFNFLWVYCSVMADNHVVGFRLICISALYLKYKLDLETFYSCRVASMERIGSMAFTKLHVVNYVSSIFAGD